MTPGAARWPASGDGRRPTFAVLGLALALTGAPAADAQRIAYPPPAPDATVLPGRAPRLPYPVLPRDTRIAPGDFADDGDDETPLDPAEQQRLADRVLLVQLSQNYRPRPALWRIGAEHQGHDTTIYLFGTIHVLPPGFRWRSAAVERAAAASDTLIVEGVDDRATAPTAATPPPLGERVSPGHRAAFARFAATLPPAAAAQLDAMPTWMAAVAVGYVRAIQAGETPGPGADDDLEATFRARGKRVVAIEDGARVMARIGAIAEPVQRRMLDAALDARTPSRADTRAPLHAWARGEVGPGSALTLDLDRPDGADALDQALLTERNRAWARALAERLRTPGTAFFAAGAGHFIGRGSVLELLRRRGIVVERID